METYLIINVVGPSRSSGFSLQLQTPVWLSRHLRIRLHESDTVSPIRSLMVAEYIEYSIAADMLTGECMPIFAESVALFDDMCAYLHGRGAILLNSTDESEFEGNMRDFLVNGDGLPIPNPHLNGGT